MGLSELRISNQGGENEPTQLTEPCWLAGKQWTLSVKKATLRVVPLDVCADRKFPFRI